MITTSTQPTAAVVRPQTLTTRTVAGATTTALPAATYVGATLTGATTRVGTTQVAGITQFAGATTRAGYPAATTIRAGAPTIASALPQSARVVSAVNATASLGTSTILAGFAQAPAVATAGTQARIITTPSVATAGAQARIISAPAVATAGAQTRFMTSSTMSSAATPQVLQAATIMPSPTVASAISGVVVGKAKVLSGGIADIATAPTGNIWQNLVKPVVVGAPAVVAGGLAGPAGSQAAYEAKHKNDPQLANLREVKAACQLKEVHVKAAADVFKAAAVDGKFTRDQFFAAHSTLLDSQGVSHPSDEVKNAVFDLFDRDDNGIVDMMEIVCGIVLLCKGGDEEKVEAVFVMFDATGDGFITQEEMILFLRTVFQVICTPAVMEAVNATGVQIDSMEDMATETAAECFTTADVNQDGKLSLDEFKKWFYGERSHPDLLFEPVKQLLH